MTAEPPDNSTNVTDVTPTTTTSTLNATNVTVITPTAIMNTLNTGEVFGLTAGLSVILIVLMTVTIYLRKRGKLQSLHCFGKPSRSRRSSTSSSRHPLDLEPDPDNENDSLNDATLRPTDGDLFAIGDIEDVEYSLNTGEDGYFYDEVFNHSAFEDVATSQSIKQLYSVHSEDELPVLPNSRNGW